MGLLVLACGSGAGGEAGMAPEIGTGGNGSGGAETGGGAGVAVAPPDGGSGASVPLDPTGGAPTTGGTTTGGLAGATGGTGPLPTGGAVAATGGASGASGAQGTPWTGGAAGAAGALLPFGGAAGEAGAAGAGGGAECHLPGNSCTIVGEGTFTGQRCGLVPVDDCGVAQCGGCWPGEYCSADNWCRRYDEGCVPFGEHEADPAAVVLLPVNDRVRDDGSSSEDWTCVAMACDARPPVEEDVLTGELDNRCELVSGTTYWCREDLCPEWPASAEGGR